MTAADSHLKSQPSERHSAQQKESHKALVAAATAYIHDSRQRQDFLKNMVTFESRATMVKLPAMQITQTETNILDMLTGKGVVSGNMVNIADGAMRNAANPDRIDQGAHGTCAIDALEKEVFADRPELATRMIREVALTGKWRSTDGTVLNLGEYRNNLIPGPEESQFPSKPGERSFASQLFQEATLDDIGVHDLNETFDNGTDAEWAQAHSPWRFIMADDKEVWHKPGGATEQFSGISDELLDREMKRLLGSDATFYDVSMTGKSDNPHPQSQAQLEQMIANEQHSTPDQPLIVGVNAEDPDVEHNSSKPGLLKALRIGLATLHTRGKENHTLTINQYDASTHTVMLHNNWGECSDHRLDIDDLYRVFEGK